MTAPRLSRILLTASLAVGFAALAPLPAHAEPDEGFSLTVMATTDVHGHVYNWDYFRDVPYPQGSTQELGLARVSTIIDDVRQAKGAESVVVVDNGDAIQGTPLTYVAAKQPQLFTTTTHPMAEAFNTIGYDAQVLGNHEFNYGLETLGSYEDQLNAPLLGANVVRAGTETPAFTAYTILTRDIDGKSVKIGVLGLVTPGVRVWDKAIVEGKLEFRDPVVTAQKYVPQMKANGADVVVLLVHSGKNAEGVDWVASQLQENVATTVATRVNDVDVLIAGHSHVDIPSEVYYAPDGDPVLLTQPKYWAQSVSEVTLPLTDDDDGVGYKVDWPATDAEIGALSVARYANTVSDSPKFSDHAGLLSNHEATVGYVNTVVAQSKDELSAARAYYRDEPILDFIGRVMTDTVSEGIKGTEYGGLPVIAQVSPFSRTAVFPQGNVTIKDMAGLYIYDNTLAGVLINGQQLKEYLEYSARYFVQTEEGATFDPVGGVNAMYEGQTRGIPDYNYDAITGVYYTIDVSKPVGSRVSALVFADGTPIQDDTQFVLAVNNYRQNGGGGFPHMGGATPTVYDEQQEIRQLLIEYAQERQSIDAADFEERNWNIVTSTPNAKVEISVPEVSVGASVTAIVTGVAPNEEVELTMYSTPTVVGTGMADASGRAEITFAVPAVELGQHTLVAHQYGFVVPTKLNVTAAAPTPDPDTPTPTPGGTATDPAATPGPTATSPSGKAPVAVATGRATLKRGSLARTGTTTAPLTTAALVMVWLGAALVVADRRRRRG